jgi:putative tricarboxylic transport membrane protein
MRMGNANYWSERVAYLVIGMAGIVIMVLSWSYGLGSPAKPGPGMYPFVVGLFIFPLSLSLFVSSLRGERKGAILTGRQIGTFAAFIGTCAFWILAMPLLGYSVVTLVAVFFLSKIMKLEGWFKPLLLSTGTALFIYLLFDVWLYIDLPRGIWG